MLRMKPLLALALGWAMMATMSNDAVAARPTDAAKEIHAVIDGWHDAAAKADEKRYFDHFAAEAVFIGTDPNERWTKEEFRKYAHPYFSKGKAWTMKGEDRKVTIAKDGKTAWFDEVAKSTGLGRCRGSGVLVLEGKNWKIAQYNLSFPIFNDKFNEVRKVNEGK